ncbi:MAG: rRNA maturation RNase YbeY [Verrucomicrobiota bacterium]|nr:rRNA maturation RNase YbeY [Verrucomicrobiota bacterium]|tara:strand:+ start:270 stop:722 length:453 start_codon:yes stop_codon:yes gene_type:complete
MKQLSVRNQQRRFSVSSREVRKAMELLLTDLLQIKAFDLSVLFVNETRMTQLNQTHLQHEGPTDIITFDYCTRALLHGELVICPAIASEHARKYRATLGRELMRYVIHGVLHLQGFDDKTTAARHKMKHEENRLLQRLARRFPVDSIAHG